MHEVDLHQPQREEEIGFKTSWEAALTRPGNTTSTYMGQNAYTDVSRQSENEEALGQSDPHPNILQHSYPQLYQHPIPQPTLNMMPILNVHPAEQGHVVLAGFQDCTEEAIRYLVDVEQFSEDDPLVMGLKQHLWERQQHLDIHRILYGTSSLLHENNNIPVTSTPSRTTDSVAQDTGNMGELLVVQDGDTSPSSAETVSSPSSESDPMEISMRSEGSETWENGAPQMMTLFTQGSQVHHSQAQACEQESEEQDLSHSVINLAMLAQNNPAIASLTEEILSLLEREDELTDGEDNSTQEDQLIGE